MDPADAEADPRRTQAVGERDDRGLAVAHDHDPVQLEPLVEALEHDLAVAGLGERDVQVRLEVLDRLEPEDAALPARVGRLQDGGEADGLHRRGCVAHRARSRVLRLRHALLGEAPPHVDLVRHRVRDVGADPRQVERFRNGGHDRHGAIGGTVNAPSTPWRRATSITPSTSWKSTTSPTSAAWRPSACAVPVDRDDTEAELLRAPDRAALVPARADEENGLSAHRGDATGEGRARRAGARSAARCPSRRRPRRGVRCRSGGSTRTGRCG